MARTVIMPRFGMTQEEATIVRWIKKEGDRVENGDPICEVTTDKINMEVEAPADGILAGVRFAEGETVAVTEAIAYILAEGERLPVGETSGEPPATPQPGSLKTPSEAQPPDRAIKATPLARRMASAEQVDLAALQGSGRDGRVTRQDIERHLSGRGAPSPDSGKVRASPAARRLARQTGVELDGVAGSGAGGRVQGRDVQAVLAARSEQAAPFHLKTPSSEEEGVQAAAGETLQPVVIPLEGMRRTIARRMQASWQTIPHILFSLDIDMSQAIAMRAQFNLRYGGGKPAVSLSAVLVKACAAALRQHPVLNSYFHEEQILRLPAVNVGVAVALEDGLIVPVVRRADEKGLVAIGQEVADLSSRARQGSLQPQDVVDGTFTLSNLGMFGVDHFTAILNPPQVAILAVGRVAKRFAPDEAGLPVLRSMMTVTLSVDHRAVDGAEAARFLNTLRGILETAGVQWG